MAQAAKRRKRNVVDTSDDDVEARPRTNTIANYLVSSSPNAIPSPSPVASRGPTASPSPLKPRAAPPRNPGRLAARGKPQNGSTSNNSSPEKLRDRPVKRTKVEEKGKTADLVTLFSNQAQKAQSSSGGGAMFGHGLGSLDDIFDDPISDDDEFADSKASVSSAVGQAAKKRQMNGPSQFASSAPSAPFSTSHKFLKPARPRRPDALDDDLRPWSERFGPVNLDELAVHKRKVADVKRWLEDVYQGRLRQRLLVLKGAAGTGKTTTVRLLARELNCSLFEWKNSTRAAAVDYSSHSARFSQFLGVDSRAGTLDLDSENEAGEGLGGQRTRRASKELMLIEEFPNTFTRSSSALSTFRKSLLDLLASTTPSLANWGKHVDTEPVRPLIVVVSETLLSTSSASADSLTAHRLLGPEVLRHAGVGVIEFNPIAPSLLSKALELVVQKEARISGRRRTPGPLVLKKLGEIGDIRNAVSSLEFLCLKGDQDADWGARVTFAKTKKGVKDGIPMTKAEKDTLELISQREASLGIFHAVGKVVYNKREELPAGDDAVENLPSYLRDCRRPRRSLVDVDTLIDETGTDTQTFISALYENYVLSCECSQSEDSPAVEYVESCVDHLSDSDLLSPSWDIFFGGKRWAGDYSSRDSASHVLRQDEIAFQVASRGLLFSLPSKVERKSSTGRRGGDAFKMFFPTSIKLWRAKEELEGMIDTWSTKLLRGDAPRREEGAGANAFRRPNAAGVGSWARGASEYPLKQEQAAGDEASTLLSLGSAARREMVLERLPYMAQVFRAKKVALPALRAKDLDKVVTFRGIGPPADESLDDGDDGVMTGEAWATDKPSDESPRKKPSGIRARGDGSAPGAQMQKLVLSDDDIEDD